MVVVNCQDKYVNTDHRASASGARLYSKFFERKYIMPRTAFFIMNIKVIHIFKTKPRDNSKKKQSFSSLEIVNIIHNLLTCAGQFTLTTFSFADQITKSVFDQKG